MLSALLNDAARLGIQIVIEPLNNHNTQSARKGITRVSIRAHSEEYGRGAMDTFEIAEYNKDSQLCLEQVLAEAVGDVKGRLVKV